MHGVSGSLAHLSSFCFPAWNERNMLACRCHSLVVPPRVARSRRIRTPTAGFGSSRRASSSSPICVNAAKAPSSPSPCSVLCIGEVLFDALPDAIFLGGAPLNGALHMHQLGLNVAMVSRVGDDELGREVIKRMKARGLNTDLVQVDKTNPTGFVRVSLDDDGVASYDIVKPSAWDEIEATNELLDAAKGAVVCHGSLAARSPTSRKTIEAACKAADKRVFDVNLRAPYVDEDFVRSGCDGAWLLKVNDDELPQLAQWFDATGDEQAVARALSERFGIDYVVVTRGGNGAALFSSNDSTWVETPGVQVTVADTVGSGDAFLACLLSKLLTGASAADAVADANALGAWVATQRGATPVHDTAAIAALRL